MNYKNICRLVLSLIRIIGTTVWNKSYLHKLGNTTTWVKHEDAFHNGFDHMDKQDNFLSTIISTDCEDNNLSNQDQALYHLALISVWKLKSIKSIKLISKKINK